ncbi:hypothetical protein K2173_004147 [Erythroxylum novogranatense]|uniref:Nucleoside phosphorylase domain-containing protein n=1 Tax=Erythroxylum novogranatense TaxID=1862640 RepID=A0AAV8SYM7_9ROSI|nr:hypothetical protein K2173_004147 [Erythroxylum novogranatense]
MAAGRVKSCLLMQVLFSLVIINVLSAFPSKQMQSLDIIKEVNHKGPYVGLITVYPPEERAFWKTGAFNPDNKHPYVDLSGRRFRIGKVQGKKVIYVRCGIGMVNAAAATQQMLDVFDVKGIVHFGIAGNSNNSMFIGDVSIPKQLAHTGIWDWLNPDESLPSSDVAHLDFGSYNVPKGDGVNLLGRIGYSNEQLFSGSGEAATEIFCLQISHQWLQFAAGLEGMELERCVNSNLCLPQQPKVVVGLRGSSANIFIHNSAYRDFLYRTFAVSSVDMESGAVVMTSLSNGYPVIVIRGLSGLAGAQKGQIKIQTFVSLAALNAAKVVVQFIAKLP